MTAGDINFAPPLAGMETQLADRDRRIETLVAEVDSWKGSYMALAPDHDVAMLRANSRIEALTKALRELAEVTALLMSIDDMNSPEYRAARKRRNAALYGARECLASAAGTEVPNA